MSTPAASPTRVQRILHADEALLCWVRALEGPKLTRLMRFFTRAGDASSWVCVGLTLLACGGAATQYGTLLAFGSLIATSLAQGLKRVCKRTRPSLGIRGFTALAENPDVFSFPSGHTAAAVGVAIALVGQGTTLGLFMGALAMGVGVSRVYLGAHYPLDVAAGAVLGAISGLCARLLVL